MNSEMLETIVRLAMVALSYFTAYLVIERLLALGFRRAADELLLNELTATWRRERRINSHAQPKGLGWVSRLLTEAKTDPTVLWRSCYRERTEIDRFDGTFAFIASVGMAMGLLGTFLALQRNAMTGANAAQVIGLGIGTSIWGMAIALVATFCEWLIRQRVPQLRFQADVVLEALEEVLTPPPVPAATTPKSVHPSTDVDWDTAVLAMLDGPDQPAAASVRHRTNGHAVIKKVMQPNAGDAPRQEQYP